MSHAGASLGGGALGLSGSRCDSRAAYWTPPTMITLVAPVPRTASTSSCIPAAWKVMPLQVPPSRQQRHASGVSALLSGNGSLNRSKITRSLPLYAAATRSEEHTSELQSQSNLVCRLLLEKKNNKSMICIACSYTSAPHNNCFSCFVLCSKSIEEKVRTQSTICWSLRIPVASIQTLAIKLN